MSQPVIAPGVTAHRGASAITPENTIIAIKKAIDLGADIIEIDVQKTMDNEIILQHDFNLKRTTGLDANVADTSYEEIKHLDAGSWFDQSFKNEHIPLLTEALALTKNTCKLNIELKTENPDDSFAEKVYAIVKTEKMLDSVIFTSFHKPILDYLLKKPDVFHLGLIVDEWKDEDLTKYPYPHLSISHELLDPETIRIFRDEGFDVHVWTVNNPKRMCTLCGWGINSIITDKPDIARGVINSFLKNEC